MLVILVAILVLFGGRKIPQLARDLGTGIREFKRSLTNAKNEVDLDWDNTDPSIEVSPRQSIENTRFQGKRKKVSSRSSKKTAKKATKKKSKKKA